MIYVMRHGQSVVNVEKRLTCRMPDGDLTAVGRDQAARAARWLAAKGVMSIRCSPFHRAIQTARIIGDFLDMTPSVDDDLREMDCGELEGRTDADSWNVWGKVYQRWLRHDMQARFPGGESYRDGFERFRRALACVSPDETALLVTHGGIAATVIPYLCVNAAAMQRLDDLDNTGFALLEPYDAGRYACLAWNLLEHLRTDGSWGLLT